ncbi:MAG: serine/threonine-protein kinase [Myxococcaceae bacterium]|nr:serine/threonine-protein kinase [Myxococcaceae bacterium]
MSEAGVDDPLLGKVLSGRFQIVEPLGVGGMGRVYKAIQQPLDRVVALKVLNPRYDGTKDPGFERRFFLEASMTAKLKHPNTITVHDYGRTDEGIYFIAMEYLEGETLQQVLAREGPMPWQRALAVAAQVARSLREAHKLGLVHRDLKPANVMLLSEGTGGDVVKVLDFGLVKAFASDLMSKSDTELTQAGVLLGSPLYMAPEQAKAETDQRTDIYALGVLTFQCIAGRPPFQGRESIDIIVKHVKEKPPELSSLKPEIPPEVNALVMKCLEKAPAARFQTMDELLEAMRVAMSGQGMSGIFVDPRTSSNPFVPSHTSQANRAPSSARMRVVSPAVPEGSATRAGGPLSPVADPSLEVEITESGTHPGKKSQRKLVFGVLALAALGLLVGGAVALSSTGKPTTTTLEPKPTPPVVVTPKPPTPEAPPPPAAPVEVTFAVDSDPAGATVTRDGAVVGTTPFSLSVTRSAEAAASVELVFALEGYQGTTMVAQGLSGTVPVRPTLTKKKPAPGPVRVKPPKNPKSPKDPDPGYKDDPYQ